VTKYPWRDKRFEERMHDVIGALVAEEVPYDELSYRVLVTLAEEMRIGQGCERFVPELDPDEVRARLGLSLSETTY
jgi:hypothetical protein